MRFSLWALFVPLTLVAVGLGWHYRGRVNFLFDPPTPVVAMLIPLCGAALGARLAFWTERKQNVARFAIVAAVVAAGAFVILWAVLRPPR